MEQPQRLILRFELHGDAPVNLDDVIPVFHGWIQNGRLSTMLIDVADYKHVEASPGVVLIGHTDDCGIDNGLPQADSGQGFHYTRKHARLSDEASWNGFASCGPMPWKRPRHSNRKPAWGCRSTQVACN